MSEHHSTWPEMTAGSPLSVEHLLKVSSEKTVRIAELEAALRSLLPHWEREEEGDHVPEPTREDVAIARRLVGQT